MAAADPTAPPTKADHLCVLVHGLWGSPDHLWYLSSSLRDRFPEDQLHILVAKRNAGSFTYDGIETGGERVASEVEERLEELAKGGCQIKKLSVIGYSLGGLISRYAIGLLYHKGVFDRIQPVQYTTFATPHLGTRTPLSGYHNQVWNVLGARTLSMSGRQLFMIDTFRDTNRPLLAVLADPESIFMRALAKFKHRSLYANVLNDRTVTFYTASFSCTDPFATSPDRLRLNYVEGYAPVILDANHPVESKDPEPPPALAKRLTSTTRSVFGRIPIITFLILFIPIGSTLFLINSAVQSVRSNQRIKMHEQGKTGIDIGGYRIPGLNKARREVEGMFENMANTQQQEYLDEERADEEEPSSPRLQRRRRSTAKSGAVPSLAVSQPPVDEQNTGNKHEDRQKEKYSLHPQDGVLETPEHHPDSSSSSSSTTIDAIPDFPTLALTPDQFKMIDALDALGFQKHPVFIHNHRHAHAAIIRRMDRKAFDEARIVVAHWLDGFEV